MMSWARRPPTVGIGVGACDPAHTRHTVQLRTVSSLDMCIRWVDHWFNAQFVPDDGKMSLKRGVIMVGCGGLRVRQGVIIVVLCKYCRLLHTQGNVKAVCHGLVTMRTRKCSCITVPLDSLTQFLASCASQTDAARRNYPADSDKKCSQRFRLQARSTDRRT